MNEVTCRCGKIKKSFRISLPFFIAECCEAAGFDHLGNRFEAEAVGLKTEEVAQIVESVETQNLVIDDEGEQPEPEEAKEEAPQETKSSKRRNKKNQ